MAKLLRPGQIERARRDGCSYRKRDPMPERELDPTNVVYYNDFRTNYTDPETRPEAERRAAT